jgi:hypothetical protein
MAATVARVVATAVGIECAAVVSAAVAAIVTVVVAAAAIQSIFLVVLLSSSSWVLLSVGLSFQIVTARVARVSPAHRQRQGGRAERACIHARAGRGAGTGSRARAPAAWTPLHGPRCAKGPSSLDLPSLGPVARIPRRSDPPLLGPRRSDPQRCMQCHPAHARDPVQRILGSAHRSKVPQYTRV